MKTMAGPSGSSSSFVTPNSRKHGLSRFSLARFFNLSSFTHRTPAQRCGSRFESDRRSESSSLGFDAIVPPKPQPQQGSRDLGRYATAGPSSSCDSSSEEASQEGFKKDKDCFLECPLCLFELPRLCFPELRSCTHRACYNCLQQYLKIEITESRVNISCPECSEPIHPSDICMILNDDVLLSKYESFMLRRVLITEPDARWCPAPDCGYAVIARGCAGCPKLKCERPGCNTFFCYHCKQEWHPNLTCDAARAQRAHQYANPRSSSGSFSQDSIVQIAGDDIKPCPCCKVLIIKMDDGSCNHMTCSVCGTEFCWLCMKEISDLHYLSPSGCTFWGKKPWSRKKKIMWQLGMLVGAPVGIALIAGIAVPAIIIGIPVWVGRKLHAKYTRPNTKMHSRNMIVASGVVASVLFSPFIAGIAVGIGVPILLAYVYGVVPISLCRSGGCGVSTSASGVRIEFDEENAIGMGNNPSSGNYDGASVDTAASQRGVNPSIGEVSLGMSASLSLGSGSHLERIALNRDRDSDRESASNVGLAGSIASASLIGGAGKLEVQADVSSNKRFSLSSHSETASATVSLSERSANMSLADDASTKALAGSILGYRDSSAVTPVEVHVDAQNSEVLTEAGVRDQIELNSNLQEYYQLVSSAADKVESSAVPVSSCSDYPGFPTLRLKLTYSCKRRHHSSTVPEDSVSDFNCNSDSLSLNCEPHCMPSHVHFNEVKGCCVGFIDESPSVDSLTKPSGSSSDTEVFLTSKGRSCRKHFHSKSKFTNDAGPSRRSPKGKCVMRSMSFCNGSSMHESCCPAAFPSNSKSDRPCVRSGSLNETNALSKRAYKTPRSMQDVSVNASLPDSLKYSPSLPMVTPGAVRPKLDSIRNHKAFLQLTDDYNPDYCPPECKIFRQDKDSQVFFSPKSASSEVRLSDEEL